MDLQLGGKVAVVTGASRGIGRAIAEGFASEGASVAICARNAEQVAEAVASLEGKGVTAWGAAVDIADPVALKGFIEAVAATFGASISWCPTPARWCRGTASLPGARCSKSIS